MILNGWAAFWLSLGFALIVASICRTIKARMILKTIEKLTTSKKANTKEIASLLREVLTDEDDDD